MSAVDTPPATRTCPNCGAAVRADQDWCLSCGAAVTTRVAPPTGWRAPVAIVATVLALVAAGLVVAFLELSDDADQLAALEQATTAAPTTPAPTAPAPTATAPPPATTAPPATTTPPTTTAPPATTPPAGGIGEWPAGRRAWTVILLSGSDRGAAERRAREIAEGGPQVGILRSDDFRSLRPGYWVVFSGQYETEDEAEKAADEIGQEVPEAYARLVEPR